MAMLHFTLFANVINRVLIKSISSSVDLTVLVDGDDDDKMADTSQEVMEPPQTNGIVDDGFTEEERSKMRPADIDADMKEMERRKRVEMMMNSRLFREELERIIETQMKDGSGPSGLLQQISEMMGHQGARFNTSVFKNSNCVVPINDIRGVESMGYAKGEKLLRCKLAAVFRLLDLYGWTQGVGGMITARLNQDQEHFLVNPYGLLYHEVTASSLVKADMQGGVVEQGTTNFGVQVAGYQLHSTIHAARPDLKCIVHIATPSVTAISSTKCGIMPLGQESIIIGEVSLHQHVSAGPLDPDEREKLARNFGPINKVMLLTNRGALCCGETVEEAFFNVYNTVLACETQLKLMPVGVDNLVLITDEARKAIYEASRKAPVPQPSSVAEPSALAEKLEKRWRIGGTEFEALMRMLDNAGFRTGYIYRHPLVKSEPPRPRNDVEVPPAVSSLGYLLEEEELYKQGLWKGGRKGNDRTRWLNSPNVYQKVEILETGTPDPKKITKWVSDGSPTHSSTPVKIDGALQFVPKNTNPKEFKQLQQQIKDYRRADKISAGPQSHILEGVTWEEAKKMQDATISGTGEQVVLVGAASKGIIQRGFQHNAMVYKTPYAKNPFDAVTDQELDQYKKEIERKTKGDIYDESQSESEALSSFNISRATHESSTAKSPIQSPVSVTSETEEESRDEPRVLRIATKQVPAPSQPEVVLSDERSVKSPVVEMSNALREDVKSEPLKTRQNLNVESVNAEFLNEQRRSEMMTRRNANGRGVSGVSRLSSRSSSSIDVYWPWFDSYDDCFLEMTRTQELPRPMKPLITEVQDFSTIKRKMKRDFLENYENRLKNNIPISSSCNSKTTDLCRKYENAVIEDETYNMDLQSENSGKRRKSSAKWQEENETQTEINNIQYTKAAGVDFAEKVSLPLECIITEQKVYKLNTSKTKSIQHKAAVARDKNIETVSSCNNNFNIFIDNKINDNKIQERTLQYKNGQSEHFQTLEDNSNIDIYVNELHFSNSYSNEEMDAEKTSFLIHEMNEMNKMNNNVTKLQNEFVMRSAESSCNSTLKISSDSEINNTVKNNQLNYLQYNGNFENELSTEDKNTSCYVNELQFAVSNYSNDNTMKSNQIENESQCNIYNIQNIPNFNDVANKDIYAAEYYNEVEFGACKNPKSIKIDICPKIENSLKKGLENESNQVVDINCITKEKHELESSAYDHSTPLETDIFKQNPLDASFKVFLENQNDVDNLLLEQPTENINTIDEHDEEYDCHTSYRENSDNNGNMSTTIASDSTNFFDDESEQSSKFTKIIPSLDFTFSEIEKNSTDFSPLSTPRTSFFSDDELVMKRITRNDSIAEVVSSINVDIKPTSKVFVDMLADTENSVKYNLNSQNMSLIYSITPPNDIGDSSIDTTITEDILEDLEENENSENTEDNEDNDDIIWINLSNSGRKESTNLNKTMELSETSFSNISNPGSDLLELPKRTFQDLQKSSDETFQRDISTSVDQIIQELNKAEVHVSAANFVDELIFDIECLNLPRDLGSRYSNKEELNNVIKEKISSLNFVRSLAKDIVNNLPYGGDFSTSHTKVSKSNEDLSTLETLDEGVYVIHEFIHHVVDKSSLGKFDSKSKKNLTDKKTKESMNIELKSLKDDYDATDEQSLMCSTPIRTRNNSFCEGQSIPNINNEIEVHEHVEQNITTDSKSQQSSDTATSSNSSPSTQFQNFAEQEATCESTDNDTKSDDSKEKQTDTCETLKNNESSGDQLDSKFSLESPESLPIDQYNEQQALESESKEVRYCIIEYTDECRQNHSDDLNEELEGERESDSDLDISIKEFMENFMNSPEKINAMWQNSEVQADKTYALERLAEISNKNLEQDCQEKIDEICQQIQNDAIAMMAGIEEQSTSFIINDDEIDSPIDSHHHFEKVDECCPCCKEVGTSVHFQNTSNEPLPTISEEPELESLFNIESTNVLSETYEVTKSFESLPPIFEEADLSLSYNDNSEEKNDSKTEFHSCLNSASMKSYDETEINNSTYTTYSTGEMNDCDKNYSADISSNNDVSAGAFMYRSESTISEDVNACYHSPNMTENFADVSSANSSNMISEDVVLEYMAYSYDTKEFIKLEMAVSNSSDDANCI